MYLAGALADPREHKLYVWDMSNSALVKVIDGPKEDVVAMRWHPHQPVLVSVSVSGKVCAMLLACCTFISFVCASCPRFQVYIWTRNTSEDWSAFAPNFTVLEENEEYVEREDEVQLSQSILRRILSFEFTHFNFAAVRQPHLEACGSCQRAVRRRVGSWRHCCRHPPPANRHR